MADFEFLKVLDALGIPAGVALLWAYIYFSKKDHRQERKVWRESQDSLTHKFIDSQERNTQVLSELKTLIKTKQK